MGSGVPTTGGTGQVTSQHVTHLPPGSARTGGCPLSPPQPPERLCQPPLELVGDLDNCHIFYQCDINPQPRSCGDMLFNTLSQVCDWPAKVMQIRPECREETKLGLEHRPFYRQRMMRNFGQGDPHSARRHRAPQDSNTISVAEVREKMIDHVYDIVELNQRENREQNSRKNQPHQHIFKAQEHSKPADALKLKSSVNPLERRPVPIFKVEDKSILAHSPVFVEETREYKPIWASPRNSGCVLGECQKQRQRRLVKKIKRRLPLGERRILQERRKKLQETSSQDIIGSIADFKIINRNSLR